MEKPVRKPIVDINGIVAACEEYVDFLESEDFHPDKVGDYENQIYEKAIAAIMGPEVFDYINSKLI